MTTLIEHAQKLAKFLADVTAFTNDMKVEVCTVNNWTGSEIAMRIAQCRAYINTLNEYWKWYRRHEDFARMTYEVERLRLEELRDQILYDRQEEVQGKTKEERLFRAQQLVVNGGFDMEGMKKKEFSHHSYRTALDLIDRDLKNLERTRRDLAIQLECIKVDRGMVGDELAT